MSSPYIEQKGVILCRSGIQLYHESEMNYDMIDGVKTCGDKEWYREYRPANVVVKAVDKCRSLPVTREHPMEWVDGFNFNELAGGTTDKEVMVVALDGESDGEIGLKSDLTFYSKSLYDYYQRYKEVSLGYTCRKRWVDNPDYDLVLEEIVEVNHVAITQKGRGGSSVAVIDGAYIKEYIGGMKKMRTGIFSWLKRNEVRDSFGFRVMNAVKSGKDAELRKVMDSAGDLKECEDKVRLLDMVRDCFDNRERTMSNADAVCGALDAVYKKVWDYSVYEIENAVRTEGEEDSEEECKEKAEDSEEECKEKAEDSEEECKEKAEDSEEECKEKAEDSEEECKEKAEDSEEECKEKAEDSEEGCKEDENKDSVYDLDKLRPVIESVVREMLGGGQRDSLPGGVALEEDGSDGHLYDYASFID